MLAGSAPQFPHGVIDPIQAIAKLGVRYGIPVHVDSCLGGFLVPFMREAGFPLEPFDFEIDGVTSISADTHKYGYAPKGSSVVMYSNQKYRQFQYFVAPDWPGGIYASPSFSGSRAGAIIAACWATLMFMGHNGYVEATRKIITTTRYIESKLSTVPGVFVCGKAEVSVIAFGSKDFNIYRLSDALVHAGWNLNALQFPSSIHLCVTLVHTKPGIADRFIEDFKRCTAEIMKSPNAEVGGQAAMYGLAQSIPDRSIVSEIAAGFFDAYYNTSN
jgi:sphinganine-1-phosphate aldolase